MMAQNQSIVPNFTYYPSQNPNPNSSPFLNSQSPNSAAFNHAGAVMSETTNVSHVMDPAGNISVVTTPIKIFPPFECEVCNIICDTRDMFEKHQKGKKHLKKLQKVSGLLTMPEPSIENAPTLGELENKKVTLMKNGASVNAFISCDLCNVICNSQDAFRAHVAGKKHCAKVVIQTANANGRLDPTIAPQNKPENTYNCEICKISCTSGELLNLHLGGKKHQKKLKELEQIPIASLVTSPAENAQATEGNTVISQEGKPVPCELCGISCTSYEVLRSHISGKKHQKNLEKSGKLIGPNPAVPVIETVTLPVTRSDTELSLAMPVFVNGPQKQDPSQEEGIVFKVCGSNKTTKRKGNHEDVETKKQKILEGGGTWDAIRTCTVCQVVCSSPDVYISHLAGSKHAAMAWKQAQAQVQAQATGEEI